MSKIEEAIENMKERLLLAADRAVKVPDAEGVLSRYNRAIISPAPVGQGQIMIVVYSPRGLENKNAMLTIGDAERNITATLNRYKVPRQNIRFEKVPTLK